MNERFDGSKNRYFRKHTNKYVRNFHAKYWLDSNDQSEAGFLTGVSKYLHTRYLSARYKFSFTQYTFTRRHVHTELLRRVTDISQTTTKQKILVQRSINRHKVQSRDNAKIRNKKKNNEEKKRRGKDEKKDRNDNIIVGSQNRCNIKDQTFRIAMLHRKQKKNKKKSS